MRLTDGGGAGARWAPELQVRIRLLTGGTWIRTFGSARDRTTVGVCKSAPNRDRLELVREPQPSRRRPTVVPTPEDVTIRTRLSAGERWIRNFQYARRQIRGSVPSHGALGLQSPLARGQKPVPGSLLRPARHVSAPREIRGCLGAELTVLPSPPICGISSGLDFVAGNSNVFQYSIVELLPTRCKTPDPAFAHSLRLFGYDRSD